MSTINVACKIIGTFKGVPWEYVDEGDNKSQYIDFEDGEADPSTFWWSGGNQSCDCSRARFLPIELFEQLEQLEFADKRKVRCGDLIFIDQIIPLNPIYPTLYLNESISDCTLDCP